MTLRDGDLATSGTAILTSETPFTDFHAEVDALGSMTSVMTYDLTIDD